MNTALYFRKPEGMEEELGHIEVWYNDGSGEHGEGRKIAIIAPDEGLQVRIISDFHMEVDRRMEDERPHVLYLRIQASPNDPDTPQFLLREKDSGRRQ